MNPDYELATCGYLVDGPSVSLFVAQRDDIESAISQACQESGDDCEDYTATELFAKVYPSPTLNS